MTNTIALVADSTCDIPQAMIAFYGIIIIPQVAVWGEEVLRDRVDLAPEEFYQRLEQDPVWPSSTFPSPADYEKVYRNAIANGAKEIVVMTVSSAMSGTFQLAEQVGKHLDVPVHVVKSKGPTFSLGWQVLAVARIRELGCNAVKMIKAAARVRDKLVQIVCLDTLEYLHRGGRIVRATRFIGSMLISSLWCRSTTKPAWWNPAGRRARARNPLRHW
jgi:DegV family protein with EDD domain